ncbi:hypothetical protein [uncultured Variovorax sp.]|uniref:hypothetical protein n=1 Tax=uncultured Variovorax sp. TaxID=114708 RepID=UPI0025DB829C|nr:hypothetical protein [uncultured Variovorax sp.]
MTISRLIFALLGLGVAGLSSAGTLFEFEYPALLILEAKDKVYGYYESTLPKVEGVRPHAAQCKFFFYSTSKKAKEQYLAHIFYTKSSFDRRKNLIDSPATIFRRDSDWIIQMQHQDASCDTAAGWNFRLDPDDSDVTTFEVARTSTALSLRLITKKEIIRIRERGSALSKISLSPGNVVVVDEEKNELSKIRFFNSVKNEEVTGWIRSKFLANPFPN